MNTILLIVSSLLFIIGLGYLYAPNLILILNNWMRKVLFNDTKVLFYRKKIGSIYILISLILVYGSLILPSQKFSQQTVRKKLIKAYSNFYSNKYEQAQFLCQEILNIEPKNIKALELLGRIYFVTGEYKKSEIFLNKALSISPNNTNIKIMLQNIKLKSENIKKK